MSTMGVQGPQHIATIQALPSEVPGSWGCGRWPLAPTKGGHTPSGPWGRREHRMHPGAQCSGHSVLLSPTPQPRSETGNIVPQIAEARTALSYIVLI